MAQIDLGSIKFNWKGSYSGATAYVVDDVVESSGSSYICIAATTGNAPPNATYWELMSQKGTDGTDGTDLLSISGTVQGDIYYNNGSAIARLAPGTSGQVLQTGGSAANPSWTTMSSDVVKLVEYEVTSTVSSFSLTNWVDSQYKHYEVRIDGLSFTSADDSPIFRWINSTGSTVASSQYRWSAMHPFVGSGSPSYNQHGAVSDKFQMHTNVTGTAYYLFGYLQFGYESLKSGTQPAFQYQLTQREPGDQQQSYQGFCWYTGNVDITGSSAGFLIDRNGSGSFDNGIVTIYGMK